MKFQQISSLKLATNCYARVPNTGDQRRTYHTPIFCKISSKIPPGSVTKKVGTVKIQETLSLMSRTHYALIKLVPNMLQPLVGTDAQYMLANFKRSSFFRHLVYFFLQGYSVACYYVAIRNFKFNLPYHKRRPQPTVIKYHILALEYLSAPK